MDLSHTAPGHLPDGLATARTGRGAAAAWTVVEDTSADGGRALEQTSADPTDYRFPLAIWEKLSATDANISVRFKTISGRVDQAAGIAIRLRNADNYYVVRANALEGNVNFYRVVSGSRREIKGAAAKVTPGVWHTLGLKAERENFSIAFDGRTLFTTQDQTFSNAGNIALWTKADSVTRFDSLSARIT
jgi:hypothetical protein